MQTTQRRSRFRLPFFWRKKSENGSEPYGYLPAGSVPAKRVPPEELLGLQVTQSPKHPYALTDGYPESIGYKIATAVHWGRPPLSRAIYYSDWLAMYQPWVVVNYPGFDEHQERVRFNEDFGHFQEASKHFLFGETLRTSGRYSIVWAPEVTVIALSGDPETASLHGWRIQYTQYGFLLASMLNHQTWNSTLEAPSQVNPLKIGGPFEVDHTNGKYTIVDGQWALAYWSFAIPYADLDHLLKTELGLWYFYFKEYYPDREPKTPKELKDFWVTLVGTYRVPLLGAEEAIRDKQIDLQHIRNVRRITGTDNIRLAFEKRLPGAVPPTFDERERLGQFPTSDIGGQDWVAFMNASVKRNQWQGVFGSTLTDPREKAITHPLKSAQIAAGIGYDGLQVLLNLYEMTIVAAQESKSGKTAILLWWLFQFFGRDIHIVHFSGAKDEAAQYLVAEKFKGTIKTVSYDGIFVDSEDPEVQAQREKQARALARRDFQKEIKAVLEHGFYPGYPRLTQPERESYVWNHYAAEYINLQRQAHGELSAQNPKKEARYPSIMPGKYLAIFAENASYIPVVFPPPLPQVAYPWRHIESAVNHGMNDHVQTFVTLHNPEMCPPGFIRTFKLLLEIGFDTEIAKYFVKLMNPKESNKLWIPQFTAHLPPYLLEWVGRRD